MARLASTGAALFLETAAARTSFTASAATQAMPSVVTMADTTGIATGDVIAVSGSGWKSLDGRLFKAGAITGTTVELLGSDATGETEAFDVAAAVETAAVEETCVATFNRQAVAAATIDVTTLCDTARRTVAGLPNPGTFTFDGFYDIEDPGYLRLIEAYNAGNDRAIEIRMSDGSAILFIGQITALSEAVGVDQAVTFTGQGNVNGPVTYAPAPAAP